jgi:hypothetical protein
MLPRATRVLVGRSLTSRNLLLIWLATSGLRSRAKSSLLEADTRIRLAGDDGFIRALSLLAFYSKRAPACALFKILGFAATVSKFSRTIIASLDLDQFQRELPPVTPYPTRT